MRASYPGYVDRLIIEVDARRDMTRTFMLLLLPVDHPDQLDKMSYEDRRRRSGGWRKFAVRASHATHPARGPAEDYAEVSRDTTPLPEDIGAFAREVADALHGEVALEIADSPMCAIRIGRRCAVMIWRYGRDYRIGLPQACPWKVGTHEDWAALEPALVAALAQSMPAVTMADVIASLPREWNVGLQGEPRPAEAILHNDLGQVGLKQNADSVTIRIREAETEHTREVETLDGDLREWIREKIASQALSRQAARANLEAENARAHAAMAERTPTLEDVSAGRRPAAVHAPGRPKLAPGCFAR